jgi:hypothetical protein
MNNPGGGNFVFVAIGFGLTAVTSFAGVSQYFWFMQRIYKTGSIEIRLSTVRRPFLGEPNTQK